MTFVGNLGSHLDPVSLSALNWGQIRPWTYFKDFGDFKTDGAVKMKAYKDVRSW